MSIPMAQLDFNIHVKAPERRLMDNKTETKKLINAMVTVAAESESRAFREKDEHLALIYRMIARGLKKKIGQIGSSL